MKYRLNKLETKTTNNFKVNDILLDLEIPDVNNINRYTITGDVVITIKSCHDKITSKIGLTLNKYLEITLTIPKYTNIKEPIIIEYDFTDKDNLVDNFNIIYEDSSSANIIIKYKSLTNTNNFHFFKENLIARDNSKGSISIVNLLNSNSTSFISVETTNHDNSQIKHNIIDLGGKIRLTNMYSNLSSILSKNKLNNIYLGTNNDIIDMNYYFINNNKKTTNIINASGYLKDNSKKTFRGIIDFKKGAISSVGHEKESCYLNDQALSRSLPELLCGEEDVVGTHGVSSGKVPVEKLFYLMSRGLSEKEAKKIIILGRFSKIINEIPDSETIKEIDNYIDIKLDK